MTFISVRKAKELDSNSLLRHIIAAYGTKVSEHKLIKVQQVYGERGDNCFTSGIYHGRKGVFWNMQIDDPCLSKTSKLRFCEARMALELAYFSGNGDEKNARIMDFVRQDLPRCYDKHIELLQEEPGACLYGVTPGMTLNDLCRVVANNSKNAGVHR